MPRNEIRDDVFGGAWVLATIVSEWVDASFRHSFLDIFSADVPIEALHHRGIGVLNNELRPAQFAVGDCDVPDIKAAVLHRAPFTGLQFKLQVMTHRQALQSEPPVGLRANGQP